MSNTLQCNAPKLSFTTEPALAGTELKYVDFHSLKTLPPFKASRFSVNPGVTTKEDQHAVHEIWLVIQGEGKLRYDGEFHTICTNDILYFTPLKRHQVHCISDEPLIIFSIWWS